MAAGLSIIGFMLAAIFGFITYAVTEDVFCFVVGCASFGAGILIALIDAE